LLSRLTKHSENPSQIVESIEENIRSGNVDQYLPNLNLLLILEIESGIYNMLDPSTISHISNIAQSSPLEEYIRAKRDREGFIIGRDKYSNLIEYLACLCFKILGSESSDEVDCLFIEVKSFLIQILHLEVESTSEIAMLYFKTLVNLIRCMSLFIERGDLKYREHFKTELFEKTWKVLDLHFSNEEISEAWLELLYQIEMKNPKSIYVSHLPNALISTLHTGSNWIKNTFLKLIETVEVQIYRSYLSKFNEDENNSPAFREKVFMIGITKLHSQSDKNIKDIITNYKCLLTLDHSRLLPDYCYEMLILLHRRGLIKKMKEVMMDFITNFNGILYTEMENMDLQCLRKAGDYISLLYEKTQSKELAKKWIEIVMKPEILKIQSEDIFSLYIRILVLAYISEKHDHTETSITQLNNLSDQLKAIIRDNSYPGQTYWMNYVDRLYQIVQGSISRLTSSIRITDENFESCKTLFKKFSVFLQN
jgi:hypothetical protein